MNPNWKTEDVQVAENTDATVFTVLTVDLQTLRNSMMNLNLSQNLKTDSEKENQQTKLFLLLIFLQQSHQY